MGWIDETGAVNPLFKSTAQGAATTVWAATAPRLDGMGGLYCEDCDVAALADDRTPGWSGVRAHAVAEDTAERLWSASERMTRVGFAAAG